MLTFGLERLESFLLAFRQSIFYSVEVYLEKNDIQSLDPMNSRVSKQYRIDQQDSLFMKLTRPL